MYNNNIKIAYDLKLNRNVALKTENVKSPFPLTIYEANVASLLNGFGKFNKFWFDFVI